MGRSLKFKRKQSEGSGLARPQIRVDRELMEGFVKTFLWKRFDSPKETPAFHLELWDAFCSEHPRVAVAAPRSHAKSTAGTLAGCLANVLFGAKSFVVIVGATEDLAVKQLQEIKIELTENEELIETFNVQGFSKENEAEIICHAGDFSFKIIAKGAEQKLRGIKWANRRPDLILIDDLEEDEAVMSSERRVKLRTWFMNALLPLGSDNCQIRMVGTILHLDSLLMRLMGNRTWKTALYKAHEDFDDFSNILWPEKFPEERLRDIRDNYVQESNPSGYSQEYLNTPVASVDLYFEPSWFIPMIEDDYFSPKIFYASMDLAISTKDKANNSSISVGGMDSEGVFHIVHNVAGRWGSKEIIDHIFEVHEQYEPDLFLFEDGQIMKTIYPFLEEEMIKRQMFINLTTFTPVTDKPSRARGFQARMKTGTVRFDTKAEWFPELKNEMVTFPRGKKDDRVDSTASLAFLLNKMQVSETEEELAEAEAVYEETMERLMQGRSPITGY